MRKLCLLWLAALLLYSCGDSDSSNSATDIIGTDNSHSIESSSSGIRSSSSSEPDEDKTYSSSTKKTENSSSVDHKNSSSSKKTKSSSSSDEHCNSEQISSSLGPYVSPIRMQPLTAKPNADKSEILFYGGANFHISECTADASDETDFIFTDVNLVLAHVNKSGQNEPPLINIQYTKPTLPAQTIDFAQMGVKISDSAKTQCGNFKLFVVLMATNDPKMHDRFVSVDSIEFVREPIYCEAESSSSTEIIEPKIELRKFTGNISTSETRGYSFKEDAEVPIQRANIRISIDELTRDLTLHGVNGYKVVLYDKDGYYWTIDDLPPSPTYTTDFKFTEAQLMESTRFYLHVFAIVIGPNYNKDTGDDFYAIALENKGIPNEDGLSQMKFLYYKK